MKTPGVDTAYWEEADAIATLLTEVESRVDTLEGEIVNKVSTTTYDLLEDRVTSAESLSSQNAADILLRVTQVDFDAFSQQFLPAFRVNHCCRFIKYNTFRFHRKNSRYRNLLLLPSRKRSR